MCIILKILQIIVTGFNEVFILHQTDWFLIRQVFYEFDKILFDIYAELDQYLPKLNSSDKIFSLPFSFLPRNPELIVWWIMRADR
jgi:hypothetical protein